MPKDICVSHMNILYMGEGRTYQFGCLSQLGQMYYFNFQINI
jgi:hypothetical protein